jgi:hypothetical protein
MLLKALSDAANVSLKTDIHPSRPMIVSMPADINAASPVHAPNTPPIELDAIRPTTPQANDTQVPSEGTTSQALQPQPKWYSRPTSLDRFVAETKHPWRIILPAGPIVGNGLKAGAWNLPLILVSKNVPYAGVVALSGLVAGPEYAASKTALVTAHLNEDVINEHLVASLMFATDNLWRTGVQYAVDKSGVTVWDWAATGAMIGVAGLQGFASYKHAKAQAQVLPAPATAPVAPARYTTQAVVNTVIAALLAGAAIGLAASNVLQQHGHPVMSARACALATVATVGKACAWWMHIQPFMQRLQLNMPMQILAGWQTAFWTEYWGLIGAITISNHDGASLPLMFGYMVALENVVRMAQFNVAGKPTQWFDYAAAAALMACVVGQGVTHAVGL